ncbi:MAG: hypothetical protein ABI400_11600, partial [Lacisediminihabitans sp.]
MTLRLVRISKDMLTMDETRGGLRIVKEKADAPPEMSGLYAADGAVLPYQHQADQHHYTTCCRIPMRRRKRFSR